MRVFPFFVGCPRSGTTLLRVMFDAHPQIAIPFESHFIPQLARGGAAYRTGSVFHSELFASDLCRQWGFRRWGIAEVELRAALERIRPATFAEAVRAVFGLYATSRGKPHYADKTPHYVTYLPLLGSLFPEARFVHLIRDGRDVALSLRETSWGARTVEQAAVEWAVRVEGGRRGGRWLGTHRYREIRYEALVADPEQQLREICGFLEVAYDPAMLDYARGAEEVIAADPAPAEQRHLRLAPTAGLRDWRSQMLPGEQATFQLIAGDLLADLGYPVAGA